MSWPSLGFINCHISSEKSGAQVLQVGFKLWSVAKSATKGILSMSFILNRPMNAWVGYLKPNDCEALPTQNESHVIIFWTKTWIIYISLEQETLNAILVLFQRPFKWGFISYFLLDRQFERYGADKSGGNLFPLLSTLLNSFSPDLAQQCWWSRAELTTENFSLSHFHCSSSARWPSRTCQSSKFTRR